jgi:hypothetical protein
MRKGIQEVVKALRRMIAAARPGEPEPVAEAPRRGYVAILAAALVLLVATVGVLNYPAPDGEDGEPPGFERTFVASDIDRAVSRRRACDEPYFRRR